MLEDQRSLVNNFSFGYWAFAFSSAGAMLRHVHTYNGVLMT